MKERLSRLQYTYQSSPIYFVTANTHARAQILATPAVHECLETFAANGPELGAWIGAYIIMPDHLHAFVALDRQQLSLSSWMKSLKLTMSRTLRQSGIESPHWQKGFFDHVLRSTESYAQKWHYVRDNAVRAGQAANWEEWPFRGEPHPLTPIMSRRSMTVGFFPISSCDAGKAPLQFFRIISCGACQAPLHLDPCFRFPAFISPNGRCSSFWRPSSSRTSWISSS